MLFTSSKPSKSDNNKWVPLNRFYFICFTSDSEEIKKAMVPLFLIIFCLVLTESLAMPQPKDKRPPKLPQGCRIEIKTVYETIETGNVERICTQKYK